MSAYDYALSEEAVLIFASLSPRQRNRLLRFFDRLAGSPHLPGDYRESGLGGRVYELVLVDLIVVTWWVDHAAQEVRIVRLDVVD